MDDTTRDQSTCPACGTPLAVPDAAFCPTCGTALAKRGDPGGGPGPQAPPPPPPGPGWGAPGAPAPPAPGGQPLADHRNWAMVAHLSALVMFLGIPSFVGPLVVWLMKREEHPFVAEHGREALNFNLSVLLYCVVAAVLVLLLVGIVLLLVVGVFWFVVTIQAGLTASRGERYRYPLSIRFVS